MIWARWSGDLLGRQSLVTPIDWKPAPHRSPPDRRQAAGRQSLVTPIDWKPFCRGYLDRRPLL